MISCSSFFHYKCYKGGSYVVLNFAYDRRYANLIYKRLLDPSEMKGIVDLLERKEGVCQNLSALYKMVMDAYGIPNRYAYGKFEPNNPDVINHVWNEVFIDGEWLTVDNTPKGESSFDNPEGTIPKEYHEALAYHSII